MGRWMCLQGGLNVRPKTQQDMQFVEFFSASTHFWLAEINDVLKRSIVESSGLRNVLNLTTDLCKMKALLQKN